MIALRQSNACDLSRLSLLLLDLGDHEPLASLSHRPAQPRHVCRSGSKTIRPVCFICLRNHVGSFPRHYGFCSFSITNVAIHQRDYESPRNRLSEHNYEASLRKLRHEIRPRHYSYSLWDHHPDARLLLTENMLMQRVNYTHQNPVRAGLVQLPEDYRWSSVRFWSGRLHEDEPLLMDIDRIKWRRS